MSSKLCKTQLYSSYILGFFITKLYTIFYYLHYFLLFSKVTYYFVWQNLPTNIFYKNLLTIFGYSSYDKCRVSRIHVFELRSTFAYFLQENIH